MTNKRFTEIISVEKVIDNLTGKEYKCIIDDELLELLNALNNENEELKQQLKTKVIVNKQYEELQRLKQENEQLKKDIQEKGEVIEFYQRFCGKGDVK